MYCKRIRRVMGIFWFMMCHRCSNRSITISCFLRNVSLNKTRHSPFTYLCGLYHYIEDVCALKYYILSCGRYRPVSHSLSSLRYLFLGYFRDFFIFFIKLNLNFLVIFTMLYSNAQKTW